MRIERLVWYAGGGLTFSGGGERLLLEALRAFEHSGIETALLTDGSALQASQLFDGRYSPRMLLTPRRRGMLRLIGRIPGLRHALRMWEAAGTIWAFRPDYIIANSPSAAASLLKMKLLGRLRGVPFASLINGSPFQFPTDREKYALVFRPHFRRILQGDPVYRATIPPKAPRLGLPTRLRLELQVLSQLIGVRRATVVFVLTDKNRREVELLYRHSNVRVAHGAFSRDIFAYLPGTDDGGPRRRGGPVIFSLCRLEEKKRVDLIVRAFALFHQRNSGASLMIGGIGPDRGRLQALVQELGIAHSVVFRGFVPDRELYDHYISADLFTSADIADFDITTLVALALGRRAVVSSQHEFDPVLDGLRQLFQADPTPEGFASAFARAAAGPEPCDPDTRARLLDRYTWETYVQVMQRALVEGNPARR